MSERPSNHRRALDLVDSTNKHHDPGEAATYRGLALVDQSQQGWSFVAGTVLFPWHSDALDPHMLTMSVRWSEDFVLEALSRTNTFAESLFIPGRQPE